MRVCHKQHQRIPCNPSESGALCLPVALLADSLARFGCYSQPSTTLIPQHIRLGLQLFGQFCVPVRGENAVSVSADDSSLLRPSFLTDGSGAVIPECIGLEYQQTARSINLWLWPISMHSTEHVFTDRRFYAPLRRLWERQSSCIMAVRAWPLASLWPCGLDRGRDLPGQAFQARRVASTRRTLSDR
jgi:hypothetical protein